MIKYKNKIGDMIFYTLKSWVRVALLSFNEKLMRTLIDRL